MSPAAAVAMLCLLESAPPAPSVLAPQRGLLPVAAAIVPRLVRGLSMILGGIAGHPHLPSAEGLPPSGQLTLATFTASQRNAQTLLATRPQVARRYL